MSTSPPPAYTGPNSPVVMQQPVVRMQTNQPSTQAPPRTNSNNWKGLQVTGYIQVVLGLLVVLIGIVGIVIRNRFYVVGAPIWSGISFFIVAGILGIASGRSKWKCTVISYMVMSIMASLAAIVVCAFGATAIGYDKFNCPDSFNPFGNYYTSCSTSNGSRVAIDVILLIIGIAEFVVAVVGASLTCACLCSNNQPQQVVVQYQAQPQMVVTGQPQMVVTGQPQTGYYNPGNPQQQFVTYPNQQVVAVAHHGQFQPQPYGQPYPPPLQVQPAPPPVQYQPQAQPQAPPLEAQPQAHAKDDRQGLV